VYTVIYFRSKNRQPAYREALLATVGTYSRRHVTQFPSWPAYSPVKLIARVPKRSRFASDWLQPCRILVIAQAAHTPPALPGLCTQMHENVKMLLAGIMVGRAAGASPPRRCDHSKSFTRMVAINARALCNAWPSCGRQRCHVLDKFILGRDQSVGGQK
jgi:hypothetical protein